MPSVAAQPGEETRLPSPKRQKRSIEGLKKVKMSELDDFRKAKDEFFGKDHHSPLTPSQRSGFAGLEYFPADAEEVASSK